MGILGKDDPWVQDPWVDNSAVLDRHAIASRTGLAFIPAATAGVAAVQVSSAFPVGDRFVAVGEAQQNGLTGGQCFMAVFGPDGSPQGTYHFYRGTATRVGGYYAAPLPNGNVLIVQTVNADATYGAHVMFSEIDLWGNIIRGTVYSHMSGTPPNIATSLTKTRDPWLFGATFYGSCGVFDARSMTLAAFAVGGMGVWGLMYDSGIDALWVGRGTPSNSSFFPIPMWQFMGAAGSYGATGLNLTLTNGMRPPIVRWGQYLIFTAVATTMYEITFVVEGMARPGARGYRFVLTPAVAMSAPKTAGFVATKDAVYMLIANLNATVNSYVAVIEIRPNDLQFGSQGTRCRVVKLPIASAITNQYCIEAYGDLLSVTCNMSTTAGAGAVYLFSFNDVWGGSFADQGAGGVSNQGNYSMSQESTFVRAGLSAAVSLPIVLEEWTLTLQQASVDPPTTPMNPLSPIKTYAAGTVIYPLPLSSTYYTRQAAQDASRADIRCIDFLRRSSL